jgi:FkbM family methyltransferase
MKKLLKFLLNTLGYKFIKIDFYKNLVHLTQVSDLDFHYILKNIIGKDKKICCLDIGANIGQTSKKISNYFPNSTIYCFEPIKNTYQQLVENTNEYSNINANNFAIGADSEEVEIFHREHSEWNSLVDDLNKTAKLAGATSEIIKVNTIDNFVKENRLQKIDILKSDTEGFEIEVLEGAKNCLSQQLIDFLYIEVGFSKIDKQHTYWIDVIQTLENYGYSFSGLFEKCYGPNMRIHYANALFSSREIVYGKDSLT